MVVDIVYCVAFDDDVLCIFIALYEVDGCAVICFFTGGKSYYFRRQKGSEIGLSYDIHERLGLEFLINISCWVP